MRKRMIDPSFWNDSAIVNLSIHARLLYIGLWQYADDEGYFIDDLLAIKRTLFPDQEFDIQGIFSELHGFLTEYSLSTHGKAYKITRFLDWQKLNRPTPSKIKRLCLFSESSLNPHGGLTEPSLRTHSELNRREENRREENRRGGGAVDNSRPVDNSPQKGIRREKAPQKSVARKDSESDSKAEIEPAAVVLARQKLHHLAHRRDPPIGDKTQQELEERRRLLKEQAAQLRDKK